MSDFSPPPLPPGPPPPEPPPPRGIPWDARDRLGILAAFVETIKLVLFDPVAFFRAMPVTGGLAAPLAFGLVVGYFGMAVQAFYDAVFQSVTGRMFDFGEFTRRAEFQRFAELMGGGLGLVLTLVIGPFLLVIGLFVGAGITHLMLMLLGGAKRGFEATLRVACFAQATAVFAVVPFCGQVHVLYQIVVTIIGLSEAHQVSKLMAAGAVLLPWLLLCCCCTIGVALAAFFGVAGVAGFPR